MKRLKRIPAAVLVGSIFFALAISAAASRADSGKICVLIFERRIHPFTEVVHGVFDPAVKAGNALIINEAVPADMLKCVDANATQIVMVAHAAMTESATTGPRDADARHEGQDLISPPPSPQPQPRFKTLGLCYFKEITGDDRKEVLSNGLNSMEKVQTQAQDDEAKAEKATASSDDLPRHGATELVMTPTERRALSIEGQIEEIEKLQNSAEASTPIYYPPKIFLPIAFQSLADRLQTDKSKSGGILLKKIRISACDPDLIRQRYSAEFSSLEALGVQFEFAPVNAFASWLLGVQNGVSLSRKWLLQR